MLYIICGHGAGDSGAVGNGYQEQERVRTLAQRMKALGGEEVTIHNMNDNAYASGAINRLSLPAGTKILELHLDSAGAGARGGHVIIQKGIGGADKWDKALASFIGSYFAGRSVLINERSDLANPSRAAARGFNYRLLECCFISSASDMQKFNANIDEVARGILLAFDIGAAAPADPQQPAEQPKPSTAGASIEELAQRVLRGDFGNGEARKAALGDQYAAVQARVNELVSGIKAEEDSKTDNVDLHALAEEVMQGKHGNGAARKASLGVYYDEVQAIVNQRMTGAGSGAGVDIDKLAREVWEGKYGNGAARRDALGANYAAVQQRVNELYG